MSRDQRKKNYRTKIPDKNHTNKKLVQDQGFYWIQYIW